MLAAGTAASGTTDSGLVSFAQRQLPRRVRQLAEGLHQLLSHELARGLTNTIGDFELQLFQLAEQARSGGVQAELMGVLRDFRAHSAQLHPGFMAQLESALAQLRDHGPAPQAASLSPLGGQLSLVDEAEIDERILLQEIGGRAEVRHSLSLFLLGQRMGVIAGKPAFDAESLPIGPTALCRMLGRAMAPLGLTTEYRHLLFRQFDKHIVQHAGTYYEAINGWLAKQGVLAHLTYVPFRARPVAQAGAAPRPAAAPVAATEPTGDHSAGVGVDTDAAAPPPPAAAAAPASVAEAAAAAPGPATHWPSISSSDGSGADPVSGFDEMRQLLAGRRSLVGKLSGKFSKTFPAAAPRPRAGREDVQTILDRLQHLQAAPVMQQGKPVPRTVAHLKQDILMQLRVGQADGQAVELNDEDNDTVDLVGMLLDHLVRSLQPGTPAANLISRLQVPLLRVALNDKGFFTHAHHPARQMLNAVAETSEWFANDDPADRAVVERMRMLVDRVVSEYQGDPAVFETLLGDLTQHLQVQMHRAEIAEKRHVEASRGKEKLELARQAAAEEIEALIGGRKVPKFLASLLQVAWADVLALSLLRHGADSEAHRHHVELAERLVLAASSPAAALNDLGERAVLTEEIERGLALVGYAGDEARDVAARLLAAASQDERDDPASRTELAVRLKKRTRFGQGVDVHGSADETPLEPAAQEALERIKRLPFGSWFEWIEPSGAVSRRRMSWFSPSTHHALFVNHRGQRIGEFSLSFLAREMAAGRVKLMVNEGGSLVDRAWKAILGALRSFTRPNEETPA